MALNIIAAMVAVTIGGMVFLGLILIGIYALRYKKVPPGYAMILYGKRSRTVNGQLVLTRGGRFIWPIFQSYVLLPIGLRNSEFRITNIYPQSTRQERMLDSLVKISYQMGPDEKAIRIAAENLMNLQEKELEEIVHSSAEKHIRHEARKIGMENLLKDPLFLEDKVRSALSKDLSRLGLTVKSMSIVVISRV